MKHASPWWSSLALACWMLSCVKASLQQQQQQRLCSLPASPKCVAVEGAPFVSSCSSNVVATDVPEDSLSKNDQVDQDLRSYIAKMDGSPLKESDGESSDSLTRTSTISTALMVRANATDAAAISVKHYDRRPHPDVKGSSISPPRYHHHHQSPVFQETLLVGEPMVTMDIIICALVAAFVALQYRAIIRTCG